MMKRKKMILALGLTVLMVMMGCGGDAAEQETTPETEQTAETDAAEETTDAAEDAQAEDSADAVQEEADASEAEAETGGSEENAQSYEDNFAVDSEAAAAFAGKIKEAVAAKDMEALADLTSYPVYVGLPDTEGIVETREDFLALGADQVLTQELMDSVAAASVDNFTPSMAGFVVAGENGRPNIIFGVVEGKLAITGINY